MAESKDKSAFEILNAVDVSDHKEEKPTGNGKTLSYLSWTWAWSEVKKRFPDANYEVVKFNGIPYVFDPETGYMVFTKVTIGGVTHEMWLPVMDSNNCAMKNVPYEVQTKFKNLTVKAATMFDINKAMMRCLTKNLAMFGLGLYIYAGEDLPEEIPEQTQEDQKQTDKKKTTSRKKQEEMPRQSVQDLPDDFCTICRLPIMDFNGKNKNGDPVTYTKQMIIDTSRARFKAPICMECMMRKAAKDKKKEVNT